MTTAASNQVAIIGGGPAGLVAARWLKAQGFEPVIFEQSDALGGQWNAASAHSGVWPAMRTNTSRVMTAFSDLEYPPGTNVYPTNQDVRSYLQRYADTFDLLPHLRVRSRVDHLTTAPPGSGWQLTVRSDGRAAETTAFPRVGIANGRYHRPQVPAVSGLDSFTGPLGVAHTFGYKDPDRYRGARVLVCGCSISALEIASDLAMLGDFKADSTLAFQQDLICQHVGADLKILPFQYRLEKCHGGGRTSSVADCILAARKAFRRAGRSVLDDGIAGCATRFDPRIVERICDARIFDTERTTVAACFARASLTRSG